MPDPNVQYEFDGHLYRNTGTAGTPVWNELTEIREVAPNVPYAEDDVHTRGDGRVKRYEMGVIDASLEFKILTDDGDADYTALKSAYEARSIVDMAFTDQTDAISGLSVKYFRAPWKISEFKPDGGEPGAVRWTSVKCKPAKSADVPAGYATTPDS